MSYASRVYRQRNAHTHDEGKKDATFGKQHDTEEHDSGALFQTRLAVNKPGDVYEKEADAMANAVAHKTRPGEVQQKIGGQVQKLSTSAEEEKLGTNDARMQKDKEIQEKPIQMKDDKKKEEKKPVQRAADKNKEEEKKPVQKLGEEKKEEKKPQQAPGEMKKEEEKKPVQKRDDGSAGTASPQLSSQIEQSAGKGNSMSPSTLQEMNSSFGADFSGVRIHNDSAAVDMSKDLQAQAFTHGKDIYFNQGKYDPESTSGKNLLAHELTHVVQQSGQ
jgi:hypothetical protein